MKLKNFLLFCILGIQFLNAQDIDASPKGTWYNSDTKEMIMIDFSKNIVNQVKMAKGNGKFATMQIMSQSKFTKDGPMGQFTGSKLKIYNPATPNNVLTCSSQNDPLGTTLIVSLNGGALQYFYQLSAEHSINSKSPNNDIRNNLSIFLAKGSFDLMVSEDWGKKNINGKLQLQLNEGSTDINVYFTHENGKEEETTAQLDPITHKISFTLPTFGKVKYDIVNEGFISLKGTNENGVEVSFTKI